MTGFGDEEDVRVAVAVDGVAEVHRFSGGGGFVEQRGVGNVHRCQIGDHRLEIQQRFESALGNFRLIGRVGGVPAGIFEDVALDDGRRDAVVIAHADVRAANFVLRHDRFQISERSVFAASRGKFQRFAESNGGGDRIISQRVERVEADDGEHLLNLRRAWADVTTRECVARRERVVGHWHHAPMWWE